MQVVPSVDQICNQCMWLHLLAKFGTNASGAMLWMHKVTIQQLKQLGSALGRQTGQDESVAVGHLFQRFSLHLMKGNASMLVTRRPDNDFLDAEVDGHE